LAAASAFCFSKASGLNGSQSFKSPSLTFTVNKALHFQHLKGPWKTFFAMKKLLSLLQAGHLMFICMRLLLPIYYFFYGIMP
jgi:hypothetical protein